MGVYVVTGSASGMGRAVAERLRAAGHTGIGVDIQAVEAGTGRGPDAWRPVLASSGDAKVVVFSSNATTTVPAVANRALRALLAGDGDRAARSVRIFGRNAPEALVVRNAPALDFTNVLH